MRATVMCVCLLCVRLNTNTQMGDLIILLYFFIFLKIIQNIEENHVHWHWKLAGSVTYQFNVCLWCIAQHSRHIAL